MNNKYIIEKKVISYVKGLQMIEAGDRVVLGVSGGADSVCLMFLLLEYRKQLPFSMHVVHVNHGIREDAYLDALYVEELCRNQGITCVQVEEDVETCAKREGWSVEDAGRRLRYAAFQKVASELGGAKIAVAHNASDRAETMLLHLFRGSGLRGLCGMEPIRDNIIRPILCLQRDEIEGYLKDRGIVWRTDSTNLEDTYTRNRIRHHILPYVEEEIASNCVARMCKTAELLSETESFLRELSATARDRCVTEEGIDVASFLEIPTVLQRRVLLEYLEGLSPSGKDIEMTHVEAVMTLFSEPGNRRVCLPFGIRMRRKYETVVVETETSMNQKPEFSFRVFSYDSKAEIPENKYTKWFDCDKIRMFQVGENPLIRYRSSGDYLTLSDGKGGMIHKSVKDYMITEKIPRELRDHIPVLAEGQHVLWIVGYRISEYYKVTEHTRKILEVRRL